MAISFATLGAIPPQVKKKAQNVLQAYLCGGISAHKLVGGHGFSLQVGYHWRLLCREGEQRHEPEAWLLCSHERYNRFVKGTFS
ncbi:TPA: hypothetical protein JG832_002430 [Enterobacter hormaechei subsp. xiangfangensis]|nr:hypothetical protein [Enterobacter hormaechei subsp. xiangfangensis]HAV1890566.1 hypothetical protein [Enterobacter hormaechei subsp. xiangfangensis]